MRIVPLTMCLLAVATTVQAQERPLAKADLPRYVEARLTAIIENPATKQINGPVTIADTVGGNVVVFKGPVVVTGKIEGDLIVVESNIDFQQGATVTGDVTIIGGDATGLESADIGGTVTMYGEGFDLFHRGEKVYAANSSRRRVYRDDDRGDWGHSSLLVRTGWNYNRVEGLPVQFGPGIMTSGRNPTHVQALAIWRTAVSGPFNTAEWGYEVRAEQFMGGHRGFRVGASLRSVIDPIEDWQMGKSESSLSTFLLHNDNHDYFQRAGWSAFARYTPRATGLSIAVDYSDENHSAQPARDPWTLFSNNDEWRLQPLVAEGRLRTLNGALELDRRNNSSYPTAGFLVRTELTQALGGSLTIPAAYNPVAVAGPPRAMPVARQFTNGLIDARVYRAAGPDGTLSLRAVATGALGNTSLPPQFQHALGGVGSLPGYALFAADCGARASSVVRADDRNKSFFPYYGCDRTAMLSAEYRGGFDLHLGGFDSRDDENDGYDAGRWDLDSHPRWIVFFDAGRGWAQGKKTRGAADTGALYDAGAGIQIGDVGIYGALPLTGSDRGLQLFLRFGPRF